MTGLARTSLASGPETAQRLLGESELGAAEIERPALEDLPYRGFIEAVRRAPGFKLDFNGQAPDAVLAMVANQLLGGGFERERALLAEDIAGLIDFAHRLAGGPPPVAAIRTYFAPGDLVWHVDRLNRGRAYRLLWPIGRPSGMRVAPASAVDPCRYHAYMRREHPLLCALDTRVLRTGVSVERAWAHRPAQLAAMVSGSFPFLADPAQLFEIAPGAASIHSVETEAQPGTWHRSSWANRESPGFQLVVTASSEPT